MKYKSAEKIKLTSYDDLFGTEENRVEGTYTKVPLSQLHPFKHHPFKVLDDDKMQETSIRRMLWERKPGTAGGQCKDISGLPA